MTDLLSLLKTIHRPRLLIRAARVGQVDYSRNRDLRRVLRRPVAPSSGPAIMALMEIEQRLEETRKSGDASYSIARHVDVLIALMGEARLLGAKPLKP